MALFFANLKLYFANTQQQVGKVPFPLCVQFNSAIEEETNNLEKFLAGNGFDGPVSSPACPFNTVCAFTGMTMVYCWHSCPDTVALLLGPIKIASLLFYSWEIH